MKLYDLGYHKVNLNQYKKNKNIPRVLTDHNAIKLEIKNKEKYKTFKHITLE
jgi:hypothetical protein